MTTPIHLSRPFAGTYPISQAFANTAFAGEPPGYLFPDSSISYYQSGPGAVRYGHLHSGLDFPVPCGTPLLACAAGTVSFAGWDTTGYGNCVIVDHGEVSSLVAHMSRLDVQVGQKVTDRQQLGLSGTTGNSTGCHTHFSVKRNSDGHYVSPVPYLDTPIPPPTPADGDPITWVPFTVTAMNDHEPVRAFDCPSIRGNPLADIPGGTVITCGGWMLGQGRPDVTRGNATDHRWYHCSFGLVSSSRVLGNAPGSKA